MNAPPGFWEARFLRLCALLGNESLGTGVSSTHLGTAAGEFRLAKYVTFR